MHGRDENPGDGETHGDPTTFDRFVQAAHAQVSQARFFLFCLILVAAWLASRPLFHDTIGWEAAIHTITAIITLLLVALLENAGRRDAEAAQEKLSTIAAGLAHLMDAQADEDPEMREKAEELRKAVGLEDRTGTG